MTKLRTTLTIGVVVVAVIGAAASVYLVNAASADAARSLLAVNAGVVVALAVTVYVLLGPTVKRIDDLVEALRALARGEKHARVDAADFAGLADVARAVNEVAASLCENDDPNLGPVQKRVREKSPETHKVKKQKSDPGSSVVVGDGLAAAPKNDSNHPEIGEVRVRKKDAPALEQQAKLEKQEKREKSQKNERPTLKAGEEVSEPRPAKKKAAPEPASPPPSSPEPTTGPASSSASTAAPETVAPAAPVAPADAAPAVVDHAADADRAEEEEEEEHDDDDGNDTVIEAAEPQLPSRLELQALFSEFVKEKKAAGHDDVDVDFDAFQETILGECERLLAEHGCKGVRFEVAVGEGDVSLRPRLLR